MLKKLQFFVSVLMIVAISSTAVVAQSTDGDKPEKPKKEKKVKEPKEKKVKEPKEKKERPDPKAEDEEKKKKSRQNQDKFLNPDKESDDFNYDGRDPIHRPLMPRYDLDSAAYQGSKKKKKQQESYMNRDSYYPAKPKSQWELGVGVGSFIISGDVKTVLNPLQSYGATATLRKSFGYTFSMRLQYVYGVSQGQDWQPKFNSERNHALTGNYDSDVNYISNPELEVGGSLNSLGETDMNNKMFHNYKTKVHEVSLQGVITLGNIRFHRERTRLNTYVFFGVGGAIYDTRIDALDANGNEYDYSEIWDFYQNYEVDADNSRNNLIKNQKKNDVHSMLRDLQDGKFESRAERHFNEEAVGNSFTFNPTASIGVGLGFHMSKRVTLNLETRVTFTNDDLLDGQRYQEDNNQGGGGAALTRDYDNYAYSFLTLNFNLAKKSVEPLWWLNPIHHTYQKLGEMDPEKVVDDLLQDDDEDGVPNRLDQELETPKGCPVNPKGIALDSDGDGCLDCQDKEPFSPPGYPMDENCVAIVPDPPCCDDMGKGVLECSKIELPSIHYKVDKYGIEPEYYAHLHSVAERMQLCPDLNVVATGIADLRNDTKYNEQLSWNRANEAVEYLVEKYGISRDRFCIEYKGEEPSQDASSERDHKMNRKVEFRFTEDGESCNSNPPAPHPGIKAGKEY